MKRILMLLLAMAVPVFAQTAMPAAATYRTLDDKLLVHGSDNDFQWVYSNANTRLELRDAASNVIGRWVDDGTTGSLGVVRLDVINGANVSRITTGATATRLVTLPDAPGEISLMEQAVESDEITANTIVADDIATGGVGTLEILDGTIGADDIATSGVGTSEVLNGTIINEDINAAAAIAVTKLATGTEGYVLSVVSGVPAWAAGGSGSIGGTGPEVDNAIPRMNGTGGATIQGYTSGTPTVSDTGVGNFPAGAVFGDAGGATAIYDTLNMGVSAGTGVAVAKWYTEGNASTDLRWEMGPTNDIESGSLGGTDFVFRRFSSTGSVVGDDVYAMRIYRDPANGVVISGPSGTPSPLYVDGPIYNGTSDTQITSNGKVLLAALDTTSASVGYVPSYNGSTVVWASASGNVTNSGSGTDNRYPRFNADGTHLQDSLTAEDDSGNVDFTGTITAGSSNTQVTDSAGLVRDAALSSNVVVAGDALTGDVAVTLEADGSTVATIQANSVALTTDTTGNYVASVATGSGLTGGAAGSEGGALTLTLEDLTANWDQDGAFDINLNNAASELAMKESTGNTYWGTFDVGDLTAGRTYTFPDRTGTAMLSGDAVTGDVAITFEADGSTAATIQANSVALTTDTTGDYTANLVSGNGVSVSVTSGEGNQPTVALGTLTANWNTAAAFDIQFSNASSEPKVLESSGATYYGVFDVGDLTAERTYTGPDRTGTFMLSGDALTGDVTVTFEADGSTVAALGSGVVVDADVNASAAIAESKLAIKRIYWMGGGAIWPAASGGCTAGALDANNNVSAAFAASQTGYFSFPIPSNYDGSTENIVLYWYKGDTNAVSWTVESVVFDDNTVLTTTTATSTSTTALTPATTNYINNDSVTDVDFFGASSNAGKWARVKVTTNAYTGVSAYLIGIKVEY